MEPVPAQVEPQQNITPSQPPQILPVSPLRKFLPFIVIGVVILLLLSGILVLGSRKSSRQDIIPTPSIRPTATPIVVPTLPEVSPTIIQATVSATVTASAKIKNRLVFIKDGDIYESDLFSYTLLVKNKIAAGDKLSWSPRGNFLAFRPKSKSGIQDILTVYDRSKKSSVDISSSLLNPEVIDYAWSPDEREIALIYKSSSYDIFLSQTKILSKNTAIKQVLWPKENILVFLGEDGITNLNISDPASVSAKLIVSSKNIQYVKLSPVSNKVLYSLGTDAKSDLYLVNPDGNFNQLLKVDKNKVDMNSTGIPANVIDAGFAAPAVFFPKGDRLLVGFNYMEGLPAVGIYDLKDNSFKAVASFPLSNQDILINDLLLLGSRLNISAGQNSFSVSLFTMEADSRLSLIRAIPGAMSPAYFGTYED